MESICGVFQSSTAAAWVQAFGSIVALYVAIKAPRWHAAAIERRRTGKEARTILAIAEDACREVRDRRREIEDPKTSIEAIKAIIREPFDRAIQKLSEIPLHQLGDERLVVPILDMVFALRSFAASIDNILFQCRAFGENANLDNKALVDSSDAASRALIAIRQVAKEYT